MDIGNLTNTGTGRGWNLIQKNSAALHDYLVKGRLCLRQPWSRSDLPVIYIECRLAGISKLSEWNIHEKSLLVQDAKKAAAGKFTRLQRLQRYNEEIQDGTLCCLLGLRLLASFIKAKESWIWRPSLPQKESLAVLLHASGELWAASFLVWIAMQNHTWSKLVILVHYQHEWSPTLVLYVLICSCIYCQVWSCVMELGIVNCRRNQGDSLDATSVIHLKFWGADVKISCTEIDDAFRGVRSWKSSAFKIEICHFIWEIASSPLSSKKRSGISLHL